MSDRYNFPRSADDPALHDDTSGGWVGPVTLSQQALEKLHGVVVEVCEGMGIPFPRAVQIAERVRARTLLEGL